MRRSDEMLQRVSTMLANEEYEKAFDLTERMYNGTKSASVAKLAATISTLYLYADGTVAYYNMKLAAVSCGLVIGLYLLCDDFIKSHFGLDDETYMIILSILIAVTILMGIATVVRRIWEKTRIVTLKMIADMQLNVCINTDFNEDALY